MKKKSSSCASTGGKVCEKAPLHRREREKERPAPPPSPKKGPYEGGFSISRKGRKKRELHLYLLRKRGRRSGARRGHYKGKRKKGELFRQIGARLTAPGPFSFAVMGEARRKKRAMRFRVDIRERKEGLASGNSERSRPISMPEKRKNHRRCP